MIKIKKKKLIFKILNINTLKMNIIQPTDYKSPSFYHQRLKKVCGDFKNWERITCDKGLLIRFYELKYEIDKLPNPICINGRYFCSCSHWIEDKYWIIHKKTKEIKLIGSSCINQFIEGGMGMKCIKCGERHNNRSRKNENLKKGERMCNKCRKKDDKIKELKLIKQREEESRLSIESYYKDLRQRQYFKPQYQKRKVFLNIGGKINCSNEYYMNGKEKEKIDFAIEIGWIKI